MLRGDSTLNTIECSLKKLIKAGEEEQGSRVEVEEEEKTENKSREGGDKEWLSMIQALLKQYDNIFDISQLSPYRITSLLLPLWKRIALKHFGNPAVQGELMFWFDLGHSVSLIARRLCKRNFPLIVCCHQCVPVA